MQVNNKVSNIRKHAKQGAEIPGYNQNLKKESHIQIVHAVQTKTLDSFWNQKLKHAKLKFKQKKYFDNISLHFMKILQDEICHRSLHTNT